MNRATLQATKQMVDRDLDHVARDSMWTVRPQVSGFNLQSGLVEMKSSEGTLIAFAIGAATCSAG